jgi:hypothetical protein
MLVPIVDIDCNILFVSQYPCHYRELRRRECTVSTGDKDTRNFA